MDGLRGSGVDIAGDLGELLPQAADAEPVTPADESAEDLLEAAVEATAALVLHQYRKEYPAVKPQPRTSGLAWPESTVAASPRLKRTVRELSSRHSSVRQMRVFAWRAMERSRTRKSS